jgi:hypothetical protein
VTYDHCIALVGKIVRAAMPRGEPAGLDLEDLVARTGNGWNSVRRAPSRHNSHDSRLAGARRRLLGELGSVGYFRPNHGEFTLVEDT